MNINRVSIIEREIKVDMFSYGVCRLVLFCVISLLSEGEFDGRLKFRKFSDVSLVIVLVRIKGRKVSVVIMVLGSMC